MESSSTSFSLSKRRKNFDSKEYKELEFISPDIKLGNTRHFLSNLRNKPTTVATSSKSDGVLVAGEMCYSLSSGDDSSASNVSCDFVKYSLRSVDLKLQAKSFETETSTCINVNKFSAETTPTIELIGDSEETTSRHRKKPPSQAEINEFFAVAEKYEQVRFSEKYNYDIVKDVPLDGRYQWIRLKP